MFYPYRQFNSDGSYLLEDSNAIFVIFEANNAAQALELATAKGLEVKPSIPGHKGRWYEAYPPTEGITLYGEPAETFGDPTTKVGDTLVRIFLLDGTEKKVIK